MTISPEDNFLNWSFLLVNALDLSDQYVDMLQDCINLIFSILSENQLPEPIRQFTNIFLTETIPKATRSILLLQTKDEDEIEVCVGFLTATLSLCTWSIQNHFSNLVTLPSEILKRHQRFYFNNQIWQSIKDLYMASGDLNTICSMMLEKHFPPLSVYQYVISIISVFQINFINQEDMPIDQFAISFGKYLESLMNEQAIRHADRHTIQSILLSFFRVLGNQFTDFTCDLESYFNFFEFCLKCEILPVQMFAIDLIQCFVTSVTDDINVIFFTWITSTNFLNLLICKNLNVEIINSIGFIFEKMGWMGLFPDAVISMIWDRILHVHSSLKQPYMAIIAKCLQFLDSKTTHEFFDRILLGHRFEPKADQVTITNENSTPKKAIDLHSQIKDEDTNSDLFSQTKTEEGNLKSDSLIKNEEEHLESDSQTKKEEENLISDSENENTNTNLESIISTKNAEERLKTSAFPVQIEEEEEWCDDIETPLFNGGITELQLPSRPITPFNAHPNRINNFDQPFNGGGDSKLSHSDVVYDLDDMTTNVGSPSIPPIPIHEYKPYFTDEYMSEVQFPLSNDVLAFLLTTVKHVTNELSRDLYSFLFDASVRDPTVQMEFSKSLSQDIESHYCDSIELLFKKCLSFIRLHPDDHQISSLLLPKLANYWYIDSSQQFEHYLLETIPYDKSLIYSILPKYYKTINRVIDLQIVVDLYHDYNELDDAFWGLCKHFLDDYCDCAFDQKGFDLLDCIISNFDCSKVTPMYVDFLNSFYLVTNIYEGIIPNHSQQNLHHPPFLFQPGKIPIGLEYLFGLFDSISDRKIIEKIENLLVQYLTNFDPYSPIDAINTLEQYVLHKLCKYENNFELLERYLSLLYDICNISEKKLNLSDFGLPNHSVYKEKLYYLTFSEPKTNFQQVLIRPIKGLTLGSIDASLKQLYPSLTQIGHYYQQGLNNFWVHSNSSEHISDLIPIKHNKAKICLTTYNTYYRFEKLQIPDCPSFRLTRDKFQNFLLTLTKRVGFNETIAKLLDYLPNDFQIWEDPNELIELLARDDAYEYCIQYYLQKLIFQIHYYDNFLERYQSFEFCSKLLDLYNKHSNCYGEVLILLQLLFCADIECLSDSIILCVSQILANEKALNDYKVIASQFFRKLLEKFPNTIIFLQNPDLFESIVLNANNSTWVPIQNGLNELTNVAPFFDIIMNYIGQNSKHNSAYFASLFTRFVPKISKDRNMDDIFTKCLDLVLNCNLQNDPNEQKLFISLCEIVKSIIDFNQINTSDFDLTSLLNQQLSRVTQNDNEDIQNAIYDLCLSLAPNIDNGEHILQESIRPFYQISTDHWNYSPAMYQKSDTGFVGLKNLGATCYMNSVFQQLFFNLIFRKSVFIETFEGQKEDNKESFLEFQKLFAHLSLSKKAVADTTSFCRIYKGWNSSVINVREQQDAVEFLNMFLDQLPESLHKYYKGTFINQIEGITEKFHSDNIETFFSIPIEIKDFTTMDESFDAFLQEERFSGENQIMADTLGHKIDARKYSRIQNAPPILILQLKRFEYDLLTANRNKVSSRFIIPQEINLKKLMLNNEDYLYKLKGVVLHQGNANSGHYTSLIKFNGNWYKFNDAQVTKFDFHLFEQVAFGGDPKTSSAYLLVYEIQNQFENNVELLQKSDDELINDTIKEEIQEQNAEFMKCQAMFTRPTLHFVSYSNDLAIMLDYYINIFIHSRLGDESHIVTSKLMNCITEPSQIEFFFKYLIDHFDKIEEFYKECSDELILKSFVELCNDIMILDFFNNNSLLYLCAFCSQLVELSTKLLAKWKSFNYIFKIPLLLLKNFNLNSLMGNEEVKYCTVGHKDYLKNIKDLDIEQIKNKLDLQIWLSSIEKVISVFYVTTSNAVQQQVDFSDLLKLAKRVCPIGKDSLLMAYSKYLISPEVSFMSYLTFCLYTNQSQFDINTGFARFFVTLHSNQAFLSQIPDSFYHYATILLCYKDYDVTTYLLQSNDSGAHIQTYQRFSKELNHKHNAILRLKLIHHFDEYIIPLLLSSKTNFYANQLMTSLFQAIAPIPNYRYSMHMKLENEKQFSLADDLLQEMTIVWKKFIAFLNSFTLSSFRDLFSHLSLINDSNDPLLEFFGFIKYFFSILKLYDHEDFEAFIKFNSYYRECNYKYPSRIFLINNIILHYPPEFVDNCYQEYIEILFDQHPNNQSIISTLARFTSDQIYTILFKSDKLNEFISYILNLSSSHRSDYCKVLSLLLTKDPLIVNSIVSDLIDCDVSSNLDICLILLQGATPEQFESENVNSLILAILNYFAQQLRYYCTSQLQELIQQLIPEINKHLKKTISTLDFNFIDEHLIGSLLSYCKQQSDQQNLIDLLELLCTNDRLRMAFYQFRYWSPAIRDSLGERKNLAMVQSFIKVTLTYKDQIRDNALIITQSFPFTTSASSLFEWLNDYPNLFELFYEAEDSSILKEVFHFLFMQFNLWNEPEKVIGYLRKIVNDLGENEIVSVIRSIGLYQMRADSYSEKIKKWINNSATVCSLFPDSQKLISSINNEFTCSAYILRCDNYSELSEDALKFFYPSQWKIIEDKANQQVEHEDQQIKHENQQVEHEDQQVEHEDQQVEHEDQQIKHEDQQVEHENQQIKHEDQQVEHEDQQIKHEDQQVEHEYNQIGEDGNQ